MSVESQQLERAALESKDRDELQTIATALGGKPGSRAKKADLVDLVLELTGVTTPKAEAPAEESATEASAEAAPKPRRARRPAKAAEPEAVAEAEEPAEETTAPDADADVAGEQDT